VTYEQPFFISINVSGEISPSGLIMTNNVSNYWILNFYDGSICTHELTQGS